MYSVGGGKSLKDGDGCWCINGVGRYVNLDCDVRSYQLKRK